MFFEKEAHTYNKYEIHLYTIDDMFRYEIHLNKPVVDTFIADSPEKYYDKNIAIDKAEEHAKRLIG